ncbi:(2Fe-2S) ferredoxin domain-containing protein [Helicovermis profundi]|uniref:(2Fe-2S) ferredoxin domain-containing protein n=1 Tax=Helicovermis profundi TaxID=3065157 RepID=A0AAU9EVP8_9FIRM|nr:(2Fe-2S) ferredoxin domain-containing protein [Clostridia bacterium S502]
MAIKSLDELRKIREASAKKVNLRETGNSSEDIIEVLIGMATCGIAAGARETLNTFIDEIDKKDIKNIRVIQVGCMGYCHSEPTVQVNIPGNSPVLYGNVDEKMAIDIIEKHILNNELLDENILIKTFEKA